MSSSLLGSLRSNDTKPSEEPYDKKHYDEITASKFNVSDISFNPLKQTAYVQCFFAIAVYHNWTIRSVKQKFDPLFEDFYRNAEKYSEPEPAGEYRLKQIFYNGEPKRYRWMQGITIFLRLHSFAPLDACPCIFRESSGFGDVYILVFVDDIYIATKSGKRAERIVEDLRAEIEKVNLAYPNPKIAPNIVTANKVLQINCESFIDAMLEPFTESVMEGYFEFTVPLLPSHFEKAMGEASPSLLVYNHVDRKDWTLYKQTVQGLRYLAYHTRPDIALATALLERGIDDVRELYWEMLLQVLHYLNKTKNMSLNFKLDRSTGLAAYYDVHYNPCDRGFVVIGFCLMYKSSLVMWSIEVRDPVSIPVPYEYPRTNGAEKILENVYAKLEAIKPLLEGLSLNTKRIPVYGPYDMNPFDVRQPSHIYVSREKGTIPSQCKADPVNFACMFAQPVPQQEVVSRFVTEIPTKKKQEKKG